MNEFLRKIEEVSIGSEILSMNDITKIYPNGFIANEDVNFNLKKGEIHGLVGENGAGKTTLMKVLFGIETAENGNIKLAGEKVSIANPINALEYGIGMVHQHFMLVESLSVAENMVLGQEPVKNILSFDKDTAVDRVQKVSKRFGLPVDPYAKVRDLSVGFKQRVEILKMLLHGAKILLLDEPTALLTPQETEELFDQLIDLKNEGYSIVFISHKLNEVKRLCNRITVLRDGKSITTKNIEDVSESDISNLMVGRNVDINIDKDKSNPGESILKVRELTDFNSFGQKVLNNLNFDVRTGEILGVAAIEGNGQSELADNLSGIRTIKEGSVSVKGTKINDLDIIDIRNLNVSIVHEDRMTTSVAINQSVKTNLIADRFEKESFSNNGILKNNEIEKLSIDLIQEFGVKTNDGNSAVRTLSGGNIQKVVAAREFSSNPELLIVSQPTRGIDIGAADLIRRKIISLRDDLNTAVLLFSADLAELLSISDSIIVLYEGEIVAYFDNAKDVTEVILGEYMLGIKKQTESEIKRVVSND